MKRFIVMLAALMVCLAVPGSALAEGTEYTGTDCSYATDNADADDTVVGGEPVVVYAQQNENNSGMSGSADTAVGACVNLDPPVPATGPARLAGGAGELGTGTDDPDDPNDGSGTYAVVDGDDANVDPANQGDGYIGLSTYEDGDTGDCTGGGSESNSGGSTCLDALPGQSLPTPLVCGNTSGNDWAVTERDGCSIP